MWASRHIIELIIFFIQSNAFSPPTFSLSCAFSFGSLATRIHKTAVRNALANITHFLSLIFRFPLILDDIPISPPRPLSSSPEIAVGRSKVTSQILESRQELSLIQDAVQSKLKKRTSLRDEKVRRLYTTMNQLKGHAADLFAPTSQNIRVSGSPRIPASYSITRRPRGNRAKHLVRVATEYTQLLYYVSKAQADARSAFVDEIQWRISRIQSTLSSDLDHLFSNTVTALGTGKLAETDKAKQMADLIECLRTYDALQLWRDAEDVLRRDVLRGFVKKPIFPGAIQTPHPPFIPPTPVPIHEKVSFSDTARTPYAPFTAFSTQTDPFNAALAVAPRLDETDNPLANASARGSDENPTTPLSTIECLVLLDLLGMSHPLVRSYFPDTAWLFDILVSAETRLCDVGRSRIFPVAMERYCYTPRRQLVHKQAGAGIKLKESDAHITRVKMSANENTPSPSKRQRPEKREIEREGGRSSLLSCLELIPVEILAEVLSYVNSPKDVLSVARCSKHLCATLLNPSNVMIDMASRSPSLRRTRSSSSTPWLE
ncbi:hypothetical protein F5888DRAFT_1909771 [Russula emetica]|nr:hypothetical protein F5888DRAFT_1909771 [Russula emetica]